MVDSYTYNVYIKITNREQNKLKTSILNYLTYIICYRFSNLIIQLIAVKSKFILILYFTFSEYNHVVWTLSIVNNFVIYYTRTV